MGLDSEALYAAVEARRALLGLSWSRLAKEVGVAASTLRRIPMGGSMECDGFLAMARWLGRSAEDFSLGRAGVAGGPPPPGRLDTRALYGAIDAERLRRGLSWRATAAEVGPEVAPGMLTRLRSGGRLSAGLALRLAAWLDLPVNAFIRRPELEHGVQR